MTFRHNEQDALDCIRQHIGILQSPDSVYEMFGIMRDFCQGALEHNRDDLICRSLLLRFLDTKDVLLEEIQIERPDNRKKTPKAIAKLIQERMLPIYKNDLFSIETIRDFVQLELKMPDEEATKRYASGHNYFYNSVKKAVSLLVTNNILERASQGIYKVRQTQVISARNSPIQWNQNVPRL